MQARLRDLVLALWRSDGRPALLCILAGTLLALWPHLVSWGRGEGLMWVGTFDEFVFYLRYTSPAYWFHPGKLADPLLVNAGVTHFPAIQFLPAVWLARLAHWGPLGPTLAWRLWAALALPVGVYGFVRVLIHRPWWAAAVTVIFLADQGAIEARPLVKQVAYVGKALSLFRPGEVTIDWPIHLLQWRIITPAVSVWALLLYLALLWQAVRQNSTRANLWAGVALGALFYVYFYYWTAAGLGLLLWLLLQPSRWKQCVSIGTVGSLIGLPQVISNWLIKHSTNADWLARQDYFLHLPVGGRFLVPWGTMLLWSLTLAIVLRRHRDLLAIWCASFAGFGLYHQSKFTRLMLQDGHWGYVWSFSLYLLLGLLVVRELAPRVTSRHWFIAGWTMIALHLGLGLWFRDLEARRSRESVEVRKRLSKWREQCDGPTAPTLGGRGVTAGAPDFVDCAIIFRGLRPLSHMTFMSASMDNEDWHRRVALDGWLQGLSAAEFRAWQERVFAGDGVEGNQGPWARDPEARRQALAQRLAAFEVVRADPSPVLARYDVRYLALAVDRPVPTQLGTGWHLLQSGPHWRVWERTEAAPP